MKTKLPSAFYLTAAWLIVPGLTLAANMGTAFTYQGSLENPPGTPVNDTCTFEFKLCDAALPAPCVPATISNHPGILVAGGVFTVPGVDFGAGAINGTARWLEIKVNCGNPGDPVTLTPRHELTPAPHALALPGLYTQQTVFLGLPLTPNIIGGDAANTVTAGIQGATISGGGSSQPFPRENTVGSDFATVGGGQSNKAMGWSSTIGGGSDNTANLDGSTVGGGTVNNATGYICTVGGGGTNTASGDASTVGGGFTNMASGPSATVGGGESNTASGVHSTVGGGSSNGALVNYATVGGGANNNANGQYSTISGGGPSVPGNPSTGNVVFDDYGTIGGGGNNWAGDLQPLVFATYATVGGGLSNIARGSFSTVPGGESNMAAGNDSFAAGRRAQANHHGAFVWADSTGAVLASTADNQFLIRSAGGVGIGTNAPDNTLHVFKGSAGPVTADANSVVVVENSTHGYLTLLTPSTTERGILFGDQNTNASGAIIYNNPVAGGNCMLFRTTSTNRMIIDSAGKVGIGTTAPAHPLHMASGAHCTTGGVWTNASSREQKQNFEPAAALEILQKLATLPIMSWNYKNEEDSIRHLGPVAEDFHAAFALGGSDKHIGTLDAEGVALAAIQGLYEIVKDKDCRIDELEGDKAGLEARVAALEAMMGKVLAAQNGGGR